MKRMLVILMTLFNADWMLEDELKYEHTISFSTGFLSAIDFEFVIE